MNDHEFDRKLARLVAEVSTMKAVPPGDAGATQSMVDHLRTRHEQLRSTATALQESLDQLRLSVKYLVFDLEATRRENATLRQRLANDRPSDD